MPDPLLDVLFSIHQNVPRYTLRNVCETVAVLEGMKPVVRLVLDEVDASALQKGLSVLDLMVAVSTWRIRPAYRTSLGDVYTEIAPPGKDDGEVVVALSLSAVQAGEYLAAELESDGDAVAEMLGYPRCCARAYLNLSSEHDWLTETLANTGMPGPHPFEANRVAYLFDEEWMGFDYFPCSLDCVPTREIARTLANLLRRRGLGALVTRTETRMRTPILVCRGVIVQLREACLNGDNVAYDLSRSRLYGWKVEPGADEDPVWASDAVAREAGGLRFFRQGTSIAFWPEETPACRLLVFG